MQKKMQISARSSQSGICLAFAHLGVDALTYGNRPQRRPLPPPSRRPRAAAQPSLVSLCPSAGGVRPRPAAAHHARKHEKTYPAEQVTLLARQVRLRPSLLSAKRKRFPPVASLPSRSLSSCVVSTPIGERAAVTAMTPHPTARPPPLASWRAAPARRDRPAPLGASYLSRGK